MNLGLGAAQFGLDYGISNSGGKASFEEVLKILDIAACNDINVIDTATMYGVSEETLGKALPANQSFNIVTKTPNFSKVEIGQDPTELLEHTFYQSLTNLRLSSVYGLLIHNSDDLFSIYGSHLHKKMQELKGKGLVKKIGVSIYTETQIDKILDRFPVDIVQLPINVLDQRLLKSGHLEKLKNRNIEIHARTVFLQGLLLMNLDLAPSFLAPYLPVLKRYNNSLRDKGISNLEGALKFLIDQETIDYIIVGVNNAKQFKEILSAYYSTQNIEFDFSEFAVNDLDLIDPRMWQAA